MLDFKREMESTEEIHGDSSVEAHGFGPTEDNWNESMGFGIA